MKKKAEKGQQRNKRVKSQSQEESSEFRIGPTGERPSQKSSSSQLAPFGSETELQGEMRIYAGSWGLGVDKGIQGF